MASQAYRQTHVSQHDLFGTEASAPRFDAAFSTARRTALDATSWIEVVPSWLSGSKPLLDRLTESVPFRQHDRRLFDQVFREPRLTASIPEMRLVPEPAVIEAAHILSRHYGVEYDSVWLNLYRDGSDSTAWHRDWHSCRRPGCIVPVLTLGATRRFLVKPRTGGRSITFKPGSGDLVVMGGQSQEHWVHCVPKDSTVAGPRISINFQSSVQATRMEKSEAIDRKEKSVRE
jgi:alkylated DNA repair dioxygenase AlkB